LTSNSEKQVNVHKIHAFVMRRAWSFKMPDLVVSILYVCGMPAAASKYISKLPKSCDGLAPDEASGNA
jgi:hypothetical protein